MAESSSSKSDDGVAKGKPKDESSVFDVDDDIWAEDAAPEALTEFSVGLPTQAGLRGSTVLRRREGAEAPPASAVSKASVQIARHEAEDDGAAWQNPSAFKSTEPPSRPPPDASAWPKASGGSELESLDFSPGAGVTGLIDQIIDEAIEDPIGSDPNRAAPPAETPLPSIPPFPFESSASLAPDALSWPDLPESRAKSPPPPPSLPPRAPGPPPSTPPAPLPKAGAGPAVPLTDDLVLEPPSAPPVVPPPEEERAPALEMEPEEPPEPLPPSPRTFQARSQDPRTDLIDGEAVALEHAVAASVETSVRPRPARREKRPPPTEHVSRVVMGTAEPPAEPEPVPLDPGALSGLELQEPDFGSRPPRHIPRRVQWRDDAPARPNWAGRITAFLLVSLIVVSVVGLFRILS